MTYSGADEDRVDLPGKKEDSSEPRSTSEDSSAHSRRRSLVKEKEFGAAVDGSADAVKAQVTLEGESSVRTTCSPTTSDGESVYTGSERKPSREEWRERLFTWGE